MGVRRLVWLALGFASALLLAHYLLPLPWLLPLAAASAAAGLVFLFLHRRLWAKRAVFALLAAAVGFGWYWGYTQWTVLPAERYVGEVRSVTVLVTDEANVYSDYSRISVRSIDSELPHVRMLVYDYDGGLSELRAGDEVEMELKLLSAGKRYGEDSDDFLASGVHLRGYVKGGYTYLGRHRLAWLFFPKVLASAVKAQALRCFPEDVAGLMKALLTGDRTEYYLDEALSVSMKNAGFSHVVAVSGMHVGFLVGFLRLLTRRRRLTALIGIPAVVLFMAMIGFTPSVTRAGLMQILLLLAPLLRREEDAPSALAAALLVLLALNPVSVGSVSLQFSFAAMAGLILIAPRVFRRLTCGETGDFLLPRGLWGRLLHWVCATLASSVGALVFTAPLSALHFGFLPLYGALTNLLCLWLMSGAFLLGYLVCLLGLVWPLGGSALGWTAAWLPRCVIWIVERIARLPGAVIYTDDNLGAWWIVFVYAVFLIPRLLRRDRFRPILPLCASLFTLCLLSFYTEPWTEGSLLVSALDVGQGQCIAALTDDLTLLIDCGGDGPDNAGDVAAAWLARHGRNRVDLLVLTHFESDHVNGVRRLLSQADVRRLAIAADYAENPYSDGILRDCSRYGTEVCTVGEDLSFTGGGMTVRVYAPIGTGSVNDECLIVCGDWGDYEFLVTGDVSAGVERVLAAYYELDDMELLIAGHHGSRSSTSAELLDAVTPETVIISCGANNSYGHPAPEVLERLEERGIAVRRTDLEGSVSITVENRYGS